MSRVVFMLGSDIGHSVSPAVHNPVASDLGLDWHYELWDLDAGEVPQALERIRQDDCAGANVTMPHKALVSELADHRTEAVETCGAANVLVSAGGQLTAHNTDVAGARELFGRRAEQVASGPTAIAGAGGAAAATIEALRDFSPPEVRVFARRPEAAQALAERLSQRVPFPVSGHPLNGASAQLGDASLVVNATAVGMDPADELPDWARDLGGGQLVYDYVYRREGATPLVAHAATNGAVVSDGAAHVLAQAEPTFELLTGVAAPPGALGRELARELAREPMTWSAEAVAS